MVFISATENQPKATGAGHSWLLGYSPSQRDQSRSPEAGTDAETTKECHRLAQPPFFNSPGTDTTETALPEDSSLCQVDKNKKQNIKNPNQHNCRKGFV